MRARLLILVTSGLCATALAQPKGETWRCKSGSVWFDGDPVLVVATHDGERLGTIEVAGTTQQARFHVEGFNRWWDFGRQFTFVIEPNGSATYRDGAGERQVYACRSGD